jgi:hypothetical protein
MEDDLQYLQRRLEEERIAIEQAATLQSRRAHEQLYERYARALAQAGLPVAGAAGPRAA